MKIVRLKSICRCKDSYCSMFGFKEFLNFADNNGGVAIICSECGSRVQMSKESVANLFKEVKMSYFEIWK